MAYTKSNRKQQKRPVNYLIMHRKWLGEPGLKDFKIFRNIVACSHNPNDIIKDSNGNKYVVAEDYSLRRLID